MARRRHRLSIVLCPACSGRRSHHIRAAQRGRANPAALDRGRNTAYQGGPCVLRQPSAQRRSAVAFLRDIRTCRCVSTAAQHGCRVDNTTRDSAGDPFCACALRGGWTVAMTLTEFLCAHMRSCPDTRRRSLWISLSPWPSFPACLPPSVQCGTKLRHILARRPHPVADSLVRRAALIVASQALPTSYAVRHAA